MYDPNWKEFKDLPAEIEDSFEFIKPKPTFSQISNWRSQNVMNVPSSIMATNLVESASNWMFDETIKQCYDWIQHNIGNTEAEKFLRDVNN